MSTTLGGEEGLMAFCDRCGAEQKPGAVFCGTCGTAVAAATPTDPDRPLTWRPDVEPRVELISQRREVIDLQPVEGSAAYGIRQTPVVRHELDDIHTAPRALPATASPVPRTVEPLAFGAQFALITVAALAVAVVVGLTILNVRLDQYARFEAGFQEAAAVEEFLDFWLRPLLIAAGVLAYALVVAWTHRAHTRLAELGARDLRSGWAVAGWLIPGVNLVLPHRALHGIWKRSLDPRAAEWTGRRGNRWIDVAWAGAAGFVGFALWSSRQDVATIDGAIGANTWLSIGYGCLILTALAAARAVMGATDRLAAAGRPAEDHPGQRPSAHF